MKTHKWAIRIGVALIAFTAVICLTAPATAAELTEQEVTEYVEMQSACYTLAKTTGDEYHMARHMFNLKEYIEEYQATVFYTVGYTQGYLAAASHISKIPKAELASVRHTEMCLEKS